MLGLKSSLPQALWGLTIFAGAHPPLERIINGFCHWSTNFDRLEGRQLQLNPRHCRLAHKDGSLQASQGHHRRPGPGRGHHRRGSETARAPRLDRHQPGVTFHLEVLVIAMLFLRHQAEAINRLPSSDGWPD